MTVEGIRVSGGWLALREPADGAARARELAERLARRVPAPGPWVIHDLACGTGAMGRWLAPLLPGHQQWVLHDRDAELLQRAAADPPGPSADGAPVTVRTWCGDITRLRPADVAGATLITASALLDLFTEADLAAMVGLCAGAGAPALLTLSVLGRVSLTPADRMDDRVAAAFDAHQRRETNDGRLLGPDAPDRAAAEFHARGFEVLKRPSPWQLGAAQAELMTAWFTGWLDAACEQRPDLAGAARAYARRRLAQAGAGELAVTVEHADLLVTPR